MLGVPKDLWRQTLNSMSTVLVIKKEYFSEKLEKFSGTSQVCLIILWKLI